MCSWWLNEHQIGAPVVSREVTWRHYIIAYLKAHDVACVIRAYQHLQKVKISSWTSKPLSLFLFHNTIIKLKMPQQTISLYHVIQHPNISCRSSRSALLASVASKCRPSILKRHCYCR